MAFRRLEFGQLTAQSHCRCGKYLLGQGQANGKWLKGQRGKASKGNREKWREAKEAEKSEQRRGSREEEAAVQEGVTKTSSGLFAQNLWIAN